MKTAILGVVSATAPETEVKWIKRKTLYNTLKRIERQRMAKFGHAYNHAALYNDLRECCILKWEGAYETGRDQVLVARLARILHLYKTKIDFDRRHAPKECPGVGKGEIISEKWIKAVRKKLRDEAIFLSEDRPP